MTTTLDAKTRKTLVEYKTQRAKETIYDAEILFDAGRYNSCANRLYYACYYIVEAALINIGITAATHAGVKQMFGLKFVLEHRIDISWGKFYSDIFNLRQDGDYGDFEYYTQDDILPLIPKVKEFINVMEQIISQS